MKFAKGHVHSDETKRKIGIAVKGEKNPIYGIPRSEETKRKISEANKGNIGYWTGKKMSEDAKNKMRLHSIGKTHSEEVRRKISLALKGCENGNWQGGKSFEPYTIQFNKELKELIRQRDGYKCQLCGMPECENMRKLSIHHIDYNKKNCLPSNLISLCIKCHLKTNTKREYWKKYCEVILCQL